MKIENFWSKVNQTDGCWNWTAATMSKGRYGAFSWNDEIIGAHVASWLIHFPSVPIIDGVYHRCDNGLCVRPDHLWTGTQLENIRDMIFKGRQSEPVAHYGNARITMEIAREIRALHGIQTRREISTRFNLSMDAISKIFSGLRWPESSHIAPLS